jgi:epoxyqueuosine reductase QueG
MNELLRLVALHLSVGEEWVSESKVADLKSEVVKFLKERGAFKVGVASAEVGFERAVGGCRPLDVMKDGKSIIVFAIYVGPDYYRTVKIEGKTMGDDRIGYIFRDWLAYELIEFLKAKGFCAVFPTGDFDKTRKIARLSFKLAAHESGIGVYRKCGLIVTPEYGPRVNIGVVVTDAVLEPDKKLDFNPCQACEVCVKVCPVKAVREGLDPPISHDREECVSFVQGLRDETGEKKFFCGYCFDKCPVGRTKKRSFLISRYRRLADLRRSEREGLIRKVSLGRR